MKHRHRVFHPAVSEPSLELAVRPTALIMAKLCVSAAGVEGEMYIDYLTLLHPFPLYISFTKDIWCQQGDGEE